MINLLFIATDLVFIPGGWKLQGIKFLAYQQIEVKTLSPKDSEYQLMLEISENEDRKNFTKLERLDGTRQLERIEMAKDKERMEEGYGVFFMEKQ